MLIIVEC